MRCLSCNTRKWSVCCGKTHLLERVLYLKKLHKNPFFKKNQQHTETLGRGNDICHFEMYLPKSSRVLIEYLHSKLAHRKHLHIYHESCHIYDTEKTSLTLLITQLFVQWTPGIQQSDARRAESPSTRLV